MLRNVQLLLLCFLPFFLMVSLGGFVNSSAVILWSLVPPFGALIFSDVKKSRFWFLLYVVLLIFGTYFDFTNQFSSQMLSFGFIHYFFLLNLSVIPFMLFIMLYYFVDQKNKAFVLLKNVMNNEFSNLITNLDIESEKDDNSVLLLILDAGGLTIFTKFFTRESEYDEQLIGGFLTAINTFSKEAFGANFLRQMNYKNFHILFDVVDDYRIVYAFKGDLLSATKKFNEFVQSIQAPNYLSIFEKRTNQDLNGNSEINMLLNSVFPN